MSWAVPKYSHVKKLRLKRALNYHYIQVKALNEEIMECFGKTKVPLEVKNLIKNELSLIEKIEGEVK